MIGAGLPQLVGLVGRARSYSERLFACPGIGALSPVDAKNALQGPVEREGVSFAEDALVEIIRVTEGYPYFIQEWGYQAWNIAQEPVITIDIVRQAEKQAIARLDESFFRIRFDRLTPREKEYLRAMAELGKGPHRSGDIADLLDMHVRSAAPLRKGMIWSPAHGDTDFTVPLFDQFMRRTIPSRPITNRRA